MNKLSHYYIINSKHHNATTEDNISFTLPAHRFNKVRNFKIKKIILPYTWYPINSNNNLVTVFKAGDIQDRSFNIAPGNYTISQLIIVLKQQLDLLAGPAIVFTVTYNDITNKILIVSDAFHFSIRKQEVLGYKNDSVLAISAQAENIINVSGTNYFKILSNSLTQYNTRVRNTNFTGNNYLYIGETSDYNFGNIISIEPDEYVYDYNSQIETRIDIELLNSNNQLLGGTDKLNGQHWILILEFF